MITIDGSLGEGGGQVLRTALSLAVCTGKPVRIDRIRAKRQKPGMMRQHLAAAQAAAAICGGELTGAGIGADSITFEPGAVRPGDYRFAVGSAGSTTLLQTVLPAMLTADAPSTLILEGGTHNPMAPPFDFIDRVYLPLVNRMGPTVTATLERPGFYPAGGGRMQVHIEPCRQLEPLVLEERGEVKARRALAIVSALSGDIAKRELRVVAAKLGWPDEALQIRQLNAGYGPGNALMLEIASEHVTELFTAFGERGVSAEAVAERAVREARSYLVAGVPVAEHLADQLQIPVALAGGRYVGPRPTTHAATNAEVIKAVLGVELTVEQVGDGAWAYMPVQ